MKRHCEWDAQDGIQDSRSESV